MAKGKTMVPFKGTKEQEQQLKNVIAELHDAPGALMPCCRRRRISTVICLSRCRSWWPRD